MTVSEHNCYHVIQLLLVVYLLHVLPLCVARGWGRDSVDSKNCLSLIVTSASTPGIVNIHVCRTDTRTLHANPEDPGIHAWQLYTLEPLLQYTPEIWTPLCY